MSMNGSNKVVVIGGGAAGMMAAGRAAELGADVTLIEKNDRLGKKLFITGKGRCNVTNNCTAEDAQKNVPTNPRFLFSSLSAFSPADAMAFFEELGCELKTERGNRVFPVSDHSASVVDALKKYLRLQHVQTVTGTVSDIFTQDGVVTGVRTEQGSILCNRVIVATGGCSYPLTGSTGDGYRLAEALGHTIVPPVGSLVPLVEKGHDCAAMQGLALKNVSVKLINSKKKVIFEEFGELLFTHFGLSGPVVLSASSHMGRREEAYTLSIDLKPALDEAQLDARILRDFEKFQNRDFINSLGELLPSSMIPVVVKRSGIDPMTKVNSVTKQQRRQLLEILKHFTVEIACKAPVEEAIITSGGVKVSEVDPRTMESKKVKGLYFAGEILDVDAYTGGFNLQIAWATGRAAGTAAAQKEE
ncbi:MAG: NAD(P)/FAD-dependent oxidoreductase [Clostridia bacterium]|nr:NAD(P)/FAD-dependent oxidoreductase [Clostridia bacterium]